MIIDANVKPNVHDQVFVEAEVAGRAVPFRAVVVNVLPGALWLGLINPDPRLEQIRHGDPVTLTFRRNGAGMVASEHFMNHLGTTQSRLFSVEWHDDCQMVQRRQQLRVNTECPIEYVVLQAEITEPGMSGKGVTRNLSAGGLQFRLDRPIDDTVQRGDLLELRLSLDNGMVLADATVIRVEDMTDIGPDGKPLPPAKCTHQRVTTVAVQFESISETAQDRIVRYIFNLQRMQRDIRPTVR